ncbi:uridine kinase [Streptomyces sp. NPDC060198]|uniref:uridine kinase family protein n=1 Tax=Streptomyces sp. NPDC060198 TaxID=3347070 RepID=UPI0036483571
MSESLRGLAPERAARIASLVGWCRPLWDRGRGTEAVQRSLRDRGASVIDSVLVTRELLGARPDSLAEAKGIVLSSSARIAELRYHQKFMGGIERAQGLGDAILGMNPPHDGAVRLVAVDGAGGSGKTTLAAAVAEYVGDCAVVHGDDFYRPMPDHERDGLDAEQGYHRYVDRQRLRLEVLEPLRSRQSARYRAYDWATGQLGSLQEIVSTSVVIVEGVYSARPELSAFYDLTV